MGIEGITFTLAFFGLLVAAIAKHPRYGMYAYLAAFYVHPPSRWWGAALPDFRWSLLSSIVTLVAVWRLPVNKLQPSWLSTVPAKILVCFTVWVWIQNGWAMDADKQMELSVMYSKYLILFYMIYRICDSPEEVDHFLLGHVAGCFYLGYLAFGQPVSGRLEGVGGPGIDEANAFAMQLATAVMCGAMMVLVQRKLQLAFVVIAMAFILDGVVLAGSRGAFLSIIASGIVLVFMKPEKYRKLFYALAILGVALLLVVANESFWSRIGTMGAAVDDTKEMDTSAESRLVIVEAQGRMAVRYPFGTGHRGTEVLSRDYIEAKYLTLLPDGSTGARSSHNTFMSALVEQGIPGAGMFVAMLWWCRLAARDLRRRSSSLSTGEVANNAAIVAALTVVFIAGIFVDYIKAEVQIWFFALLAAVHNYRSSTTKSDSFSA